MSVTLNVYELPSPAESKPDTKPCSKGLFLFVDDTVHDTSLAHRTSIQFFLPLSPHERHTHIKRALRGHHTPCNAQNPQKWPFDRPSEFLAKRVGAFLPARAATRRMASCDE